MASSMNSLASTGPPRALLPLLLLLFGLGACSPDASATSGAASGEDADLTQAQRDILDLIIAVTPPSPVDPPGEKSDWFGRRKDLLDRLRAGGPEVGREALRMYHVRSDSIPEIRSGLLEIAAFAAPEETRPVLVELVSTYGDELYVRTQAADFLASTSPETAVEVLGPILSGETRGTFPPEDQLLEAWNSAAQSTGADRIPLLCDIATDLKRDQSVRHLATKLLGGLPGEQSRQALELLLVESSGNQYIRRIAAQSLRSILSAEDLCALLRPVIAREADPNFQIFLDTMVQQSCP
jgi:hypothetical protein